MPDPVKESGYSPEDDGFLRETIWQRTIWALLVTPIAISRDKQDHCRMSTTRPPFAFRPRGTRQYQQELV